MIDGPVALLGGTGKQGTGLARRFLEGGVDVVIGSRDPAKAEKVAAELGCEGAGNAEAAQRAPVVVATIPYAGMADTMLPLAAAVAGKVVVSPINPLRFDQQGPVPQAVPGGSAAEELAGLLPDSTVITAFNSISSSELAREGGLDEDVLICGDDEHGLAVAAALSERIAGLRPVVVGPLRLSGVVESLTAVILSVNRLHKASTGIRITGLDAHAAGVPAAGH